MPGLKLTAEVLDHLKTKIIFWKFGKEQIQILYHHQ
jgi:hypothetical protein